MKQLDPMYDKVMKKNKYGYVTVGIREQHYLYNNHSLRKQPKINMATYKSVLEFLFIKIWHNIFKKRWIFRAPLKFGQFYVVETVGSSGYFNDWVNTKKQGKLVKAYNYHTGGKGFFIRWNKYLAKLFHGNFYKFKPYRGSAEELSGTRGLSMWIKHCSEDPYLEDFKGHLI